MLPKNEADNYKNNSHTDIYSVYLPCVRIWLGYSDDR